MKTKIAIIFFCQALFSCNSSIRDERNTDFIKLDSIFSKVTTKNIQDFDFKTIDNNNVWNWPHSRLVQEVDSNFYKRYLKTVKVFNQWNDYQDFYLVGSSQINEKKYFIIAQWIHNGDESNMYLIEFAQNGIISKY